MPFSKLARPHLPANNVIPASHIRLGAEPVTLCIPGLQPSEQPKVNLVREGDVVRAIEIVCTCGKRIVLNCVY
jgi:hypothetical protein